MGKMAKVELKKGLGNARGAAWPPPRMVAENHRIPRCTHPLIRPFAPFLRSHLIRSDRPTNKNRRPPLTLLPEPGY